MFNRLRAAASFMEKPPQDAEIKESHAGDPQVVEATEYVVDADFDKDEPGGDDIHARFLPSPEKRSLSEALSGRESLDAAKPDLWRLLYYLRSGTEGCDSEVPPKPMLARYRSLLGKSKWQNIVMHQISLLDMASKEPAARQGRMAMWAKHMDKAKEEHCPTLPSNVKLDHGDVVAAKIGHTWQPAMVLSMWRSFKGKSGNGQLVSGELARGSLSAARVVCSLAWFIAVKCQGSRS